MVKLRIWLGVLVWWLFLFYNIERINEPINISTFVYVLIPVSAGIIMIAPRLWRKVHIAIYMALVLLVYLLLKPLFGYEVINWALPITITEAVSIIVTLYLVERINEIVWDFEDTIAHITFRQIGLPARIYETFNTEDLYREVKRSRRFRHPLTLLVARPSFDPAHINLNPIVEELQEKMAARYLHTRLLKLLSEHLRDCDMVVVGDEEFIILLPETKQQEASHIITQLRHQVKHDLNVDINFGVAAFPEQAVTLRGLIDEAEQNIVGNRNGMKKEQIVT